MSCSNILNDYDGVRHNYTRKGGLVWQEVFLPDNAPAEWADRSVLWNAVEAAETTKESRLARMFVVALPIELNHEQQTALLTEYIRQQFVVDGMCADVALHDPDPPGHNPHAHILLTMRPLDEHGDWQYKTEKEYLCVRGDEERGFTADEFTQAKLDGWEKQYPYKVGRKKVYMAPSIAEAQGLVRASKHPKNTRYGRQNPITERWNSESQLLMWRASWAETCNRHLEMAASEARIDHRSNAERGIDEQPTVHESIAARMIEKRGGTSVLCEMNRQIRADNTLLRVLKEQVQKLMDAVKQGVPALLEGLRDALVLIQYQLLFNAGQQDSLSKRLAAVGNLTTEYKTIQNEIKNKTKQRKALLAEQAALSPLQFIRSNQISQEVASLTEDIEELRFRKEQLLASVPDGDIKRVARQEKDLNVSMTRLVAQHEQLSTQKASIRADYDAALAEVDAADLTTVQTERATIRTERREGLVQRLQDTYGKHYRPGLLTKAERIIDTELGEQPAAEERHSLREQLNIHKQTQEHHPEKNKHDHARGR
ncbi:MAG: MobA/MobL family protein [Clostridia bacterium]|nr:MobA/MobL family protein [Clostridia bacterium]